MDESFHKRVIALIKKIPKGKVATYGQLAGLAGSPRAARQVVRALHTSSEKERLPWHRVVNIKGRISLPHGAGFEEQQARLEAEAVVLDRHGTIDLDTFLWSGK